MSRHHLDDALNAARQEASARQAHAKQPVVPPQNLQTKEESKGERERASAEAAQAFAKHISGHAKKLHAMAASAPAAELTSKSGFGDLVSRLISRRAADAGLPEQRIMAAIAGSQAVSAGANRPSVASMGMPTTSSASLLDPNLVLLVNRVTGGFLDTEYVLASNLGAVGYLNHHFTLTAASDTVLNNFFTVDVPNIIVNPSLSTSPTYPQLWNDVLNGSALDLFNAEFNATGLTPNGGGVAPFFQGAAIGRAILTKRMLVERMVECWTDHFNIDLFSGFQGLFKPVDDREVIRSHALTSFGDMLNASAHSVAMLTYLDQATSSTPSPNENYARELLELHSVGEGQGYTEDDVRNVAKILTGFTFNITPGPNLLEFAYNPAFHEPAPTGGYSILALEPPANQILVPEDTTTGGRQEGEDLLLGLQAHPNTANYIARKLLRFMLCYESDTPQQPTPAQVAAVAAKYNFGGITGNIEEMLREILDVTPTGMLAGLLSSTPSKLKVKRPFQLATTFLRAVGGVPVWSTSQQVVIDNAGTGYSEGDDVTVLGGPLQPGGNQAVFRVAAIDAATGAITAMGLVSEGDYTSLPFTTASATSTNGNGTGCMVRVFPAFVNPFKDITERLKALSHAPFEWGPPDGYPDEEQAWIGNLLGRWQLLGDLARNQVDGIEVDHTDLLNRIASVAPTQVGFYLNVIIAGCTLTSDEEALLQAYFDWLVVLATTPVTPGGTVMHIQPSEFGVAVAELFALAGSAPSYQYY